MDLFLICYNCHLSTWLKYYVLWVCSVLIRFCFHFKPLKITFKIILSLEQSDKGIFLLLILINSCFKWKILIIIKTNFFNIDFLLVFTNFVININ